MKFLVSTIVAVLLYFVLLFNLSWAFTGPGSSSGIRPQLAILFLLVVVASAVLSTASFFFKEKQLQLVILALVVAACATFGMVSL